MKILIIEGIATSGKSTIISSLQNELSNLNVVVATEEETHVPIMKKRDELHIQYFLELLDRLIGNRPDLLICDRLYLTQAIRAKVSLSEYREIEDKLLGFDTTTVFLKVQEAAIAERVHQASQHRDSKWREYIKTRGSSLEEIAHYYKEQQSNQLDLLVTSKLPYKIYDTTSHNYTDIAQDIATTLVR